MMCVFVLSKDDEEIDDAVGGAITLRLGCVQAERNGGNDWSLATELGWGVSTVGEFMSQSMKKD